MKPTSSLGRFTIASIALLLISFLNVYAIQAKERVFVSIGTGGPTGVYFVVGNAICRMVHKEAAEGRDQGRKHGIRCAAPSTDGSTYNIGNIKSGGVDFGVVQSDWQHHAYHGTDKFADAPFDDLRAVFSVHHEPFHLIVGRDTVISEWGDLAGKRVNIGNLGSGQRGTMEILMAAHGMTRDDFGITTELTSTEQPMALCEGKIDAYGYTVGVPNAGVAVATDGCGARIINMDSAVVKELVDNNSFYSFARIPKGMYKTSTSDVDTFGVTATLVTSANQPEEIVYEIVRAVFENFDDFRKLHPAFADLEPAGMISDGLSAPLHSGAIRYYKEKGWL